MATYRLTRHARRDLLEIWQRITEPGVCVMRVLHGRRDLAALFHP